jgi:hypothetical protein
MPRTRRDAQGWKETLNADAATAITPAAAPPAPVVDAALDTASTDLQKVAVPPHITLYEHFDITKTSLRMKSNASFEEWVSMGSTLRFFEICINFALGDWMNAGEGKWGDKVAQVIDVTDFAIETVRNYAWVAAKVPPENRVESLPFTFHQVVAAIDSKIEQKRWLDRAVKHNWTVNELKRQIKAKQLGVEASNPGAQLWLVEVECDNEDDAQACLRQLENLERKGKIKNAAKPH